MLADLPIFGVFGSHESGKTTLIEKLLPRLLGQGLSVAVAKIHGSRIEVDRPGKDSDRFYQAGADVWMHGRDEGFGRSHVRPDDPVAARLCRLARRHDLVLVEGRRPFGCAKVWLLGEGETEPPADAGPLVACWPRDADRLEATWNILQAWLPLQWRRTPVYACILIGGRSTRMGRPKHLIRRGGVSWIERTAAALAGLAERIAVVGAGNVPRALSGITRLADAPDAEGPLAGILAAMRWAPWASWLVVACDLPNLSREALEWLLSTRAPGVWAALPRLPGRGGVEPLLAHYDFRARAILEEPAAEGKFAPSLLAGRAKVLAPAPPAGLAAAWENVNTPADLARAGSGSRRPSPRRAW